ncbi:MAG TPA: hypothetical protein VN739_04430 [Nitrososphaerales archaeon]|nr:hypothetical protein [Nitrososphaerales archaeon]
MIVEENPIFLKCYYDCLFLSGYRINGVKVYREAANFFIAFRPEMIILGSCRSETRRLNFARELVQLEPRCKIILLSPKAKDSERTEKIGFDLILSAKISREKFLDGVGALTHTKNFEEIVAR